MTESIVEKLKAKSGGRKRGRAMFLAHLKDIQTCLDSGFLKKDIWESLREEGKLNLGYSQFLSYVKEFCEVEGAPKRTLQQSLEKREEKEGAAPRIAPVRTTEDLQQKLIAGSQRKREEW